MWIKTELWLVIVMVTMTPKLREHKQNWILSVTMTLRFMACIECAPSSQGRACHELKEYKMKYPDGTSNCVPCSKCQKGQCVASHCFEYTDTTCRTPRQNEYIEGHVCTVCSDCGNNRIVLRNCTKHADTDCGDCESGYTWDPMIEDCVLSNNAIVSSLPRASIAFIAEPSGYFTTLKPEQRVTPQEGIPGVPGNAWIYVVGVVGGLVVLVVLGLGFVLACVKVKKCQKQRYTHRGENERRDNNESSATLLEDNRDDKGVENASSTDCQQSKESEQYHSASNDEKGINLFTNGHASCNMDGKQEPIERIP
ncbi:unnamed protein product [Owenia fusiformis]|uniref:TNFR-Cys domain-containing protein n=1 Tax=Owenia fusiformis TaxID=6347 RepID=A0A8S4QB03_OWEFU|nr:unnamed protein product [Owenia fusiformis]